MGERQCITRLRLPASTTRQQGVQNGVTCTFDQYGQQHHSLHQGHFKFLVHIHIRGDKVNHIWVTTGEK